MFKEFGRSTLLVFVFAAIAITGSVEAFGQPVLWEEVNIARQDVLNGPGGAAMKPDVSKLTFIEDEKGGNNLKFRIKDASGRVWVAKIADESQAETAATRLLWAIGYKTETDYLIPRLTIPGKKTYENVRLEARPEDVKRDSRWIWKDNPFVGTPHFEGLKLMMALINNWDLKDENTAILVSDGRQHYVVSDLGSSFGRTAATSVPILTRFGRSVNKPEDYAKSSFIVGVKDGELDLAYDGKQDHLMKNIKLEHARWLGRQLSQLSDKQISDAFRAANYSRADVRAMTKAVKARIAQLNAPQSVLEAKR